MGIARNHRGKLSEAPHGNCFSGTAWWHTGTPCANRATMCHVRACRSKTWESVARHPERAECPRSRQSAPTVPVLRRHPERARCPRSRQRAAITSRGGTSNDPIDDSPPSACSTWQRRCRTRDPHRFLNTPALGVSAHRRDHAVRPARSEPPSHTSSLAMVCDRLAVSNALTGARA